MQVSYLAAAKAFGELLPTPLRFGSAMSFQPTPPPARSTAPSAAEDTSATYRANTPLV